MHIVRNGIDVPDELVQAHEEGMVVFFCGAGISYESNLPNFKKLTEDVFSKVGEEFNAAEKEAAQLQRWDAVLGSLENRIANRSQMRRKLKEVLTPDPKKSNSVAMHEAILELAITKDVSPRLQLVTTNFDRLFEPLIDDKCGWARRYSAPLLPTPREGLWNGIVYLHGILPEGEDALDLSNLVVTSGDFGRAYLAEAWAARFVAELLRNYVVCFVGYSLGDQTVRYLMDAVDVYNRIGDKTNKVYMFTEGAQPDVLDQNASLVRIRYDSNANGGNHAMLHETLQAWARRYNAGLDGKYKLIRELAKVNPSEIPDDGYVDQMLWALSDPDKNGQRTVEFFSTLEECPNLGWLAVFEKKGFLDGSIFSRSVEQNRKRDFLTNWILRMMHSREVIFWAIQHQRKISPYFFRMVELVCNSAKDSLYMACQPLDEFTKRVWRLIIAKRVDDEVDRNLYASPDMVQWMVSGSLDCMKLNILRDILRPSITINPAYGMIKKGKDGLLVGPLSKSVDLGIGYDNADHVEYLFSQIYEKLKGRLSEIVFVAENGLEQVLDEYSYLRKDEDEEFDISIAIPSIEDHWQNERGTREVLWLAAIIRDGWLELQETNRERARELALKWLLSKHFLFKRFGLFAAKAADVLTSGEWLKSILEWHAYILWSPTLKHEVLRLIAEKAKILSVEQLQRLTDAITKGLPACRMMFAENQVSNVEEIVDRMKFVRLCKLKQAVGNLPENGEYELARIHDKHPNWYSGNDESDEFVGWVTWSGDPTEDRLRHEEKVPRDLIGLVEWLKRDAERDSFGRRYENDDFESLCIENQPLAIEAFERLADYGVWNVERFFMALAQWKTPETVKAAVKYLQSDMPRMTEEVFGSIVNQVAFWCEEVVKADAINDGDLLSIGKILLDSDFERDRKDVRFGADGDLISLAINHPVGRMVAALVDKAFPETIHKGIGIPESYRILFETVAKSLQKSSVNGRLILASRAIAFYYADEEWTRRFILPWSSWNDKNEASAFWQGFLWQRSWHLPLLKEIKDAFFETMNHCDCLSGSVHSYISVFVGLALLHLKEFNYLEVKGVFKTMDAPQLEDAARVIESRMHNAQKAGEDVDKVWRDECWPVIHEMWPKDKKLLTPKISMRLTVALLYTDSILSAGIADFWFIGPCENYYWLLSKCYESKCISQWPRAILDILYRSITKVQGRYDGLDRCLEKLVAADSAIMEDRKYKHLSQMIDGRI